MRTLLTTIVAICVASSSILAQQSATSATKIKQSLEKKSQLANNSLVKNIPFENIGPTVMSGRVVDIDVNPNNTTEFYVGYASGGLWYTNNNGTTFTSVFDNAPTQNIGDIAIDWKKGTFGLEQEKIIHLVLVMQELEF